jgi:hypothetical protein
MVIVVRPWAASPDYARRQVRARDAWESYRGWFHGLKWTTVEFPTPPGLSPAADKARDRYWRYLKTLWWLNEVIVLWEHDIVPNSFAQIRELAECPLPWCMVDSPLPSRPRDSYVWLNSERHGPVFVDLGAEPGDCSFRVLDPTRKRGWRWGRLEETWADFSPTGLVKYDPTRLGPPEWDEGPEPGIDDRMSRYFQLQGIRCHVHWPRCEHDHPADEQGSIEGLVQDGHRFRVVAREELTDFDRLVLEKLQANG